MKNKIKVEVLDLTIDSDEEINVKTEPLTPVKENKDSSYSEPGDPNGIQKSPNGRFIRNIDKCIDKAIAEIKKGQSLITVASQYGIPQEILYNKLVSRSLPRETEILTKAEENSLVKWIVKSNKSNTLIFKQHLMEKVGKLKKVMNITPIFAKSKFGRMWYDYFMRNHPEIYENDGLLMLSDSVMGQSLVQDDTTTKQLPTSVPEDFNILTPDEEMSLVEWIITSNKNNSLIFKFQLMRRVCKLNKLAKSTPGFAKSKFGRMWYERFLKKHPEIYENDELLLPSQNALDEKKNESSDDDDSNVAEIKFETSGNCSANLLLRNGMKDAVVVLHDFRKEKNSPYILKRKNVYVEKTIDEKIEDLINEQMSSIKNESLLEDLNIMDDWAREDQYESGIESDRCSSTDDDASYKPNANLKKVGRKRKSDSSKEKPRPVCNQCVRSFSDYSKLLRHMLIVHQPKELRPLKCLQCNKKFVSKYHLSVHVATHNTIYYECEECGKKFKFKTSMRKHQRTVHESLENTTNVFFCDICEKGFKYKNSLEAHIIYGHLKEKKKFSCDICNRSFIKQSLMLRHRTRHSKIKPLECNHCGKTYSRKYLLREHIKGCVKFKKANPSHKLLVIEASDNDSEIIIE